MHQDKSVDAATRNDRGPCDGLSERGRCAEHANIVVQHGGNGIFLIWPQCSGECRVDRCAVYPFVMYVAADVVASKQFLRGIEAPTRKPDVLRKVLSTADDPRLVTLAVLGPRPAGGFAVQNGNPAVLSQTD